MFLLIYRKNYQYFPTKWIDKTEVMHIVIKVNYLRYKLSFCKFFISFVIINTIKQIIVNIQ